MVHLAITTEQTRPASRCQTLAALASDCSVLRGFVFGQENRLAAVALQRFLTQNEFDPKPPRFSPLVFYGEPGVGKSHLVRALANEWKEVDQGNVVSLTATDFARQIAAAIESNDMRPFREQFLLASLVVLEDIQRLERKTVAQRELDTMLDLLETTRCRFVATAPLPARELSALTARLRDRLSAGLVVRVFRPGPDAREEIVRRLATSRHIPLADDAIRILAEKTEGTAHDLLRVLLEFNVFCQSLESRCGQQASNADQEIGKHSTAVLKFLESRSDTPPLSVRQIAAATARYYALTQAILISSRRSRTVAAARSVAMYLARQQTSESLKSIGRYFGGRDHTTVLHNCRKAEQLLHSDSETRFAIKTIAAMAENMR